MSTITKACDPSRLEAFLRGDLIDSDERDLTAHLDECTSCRRELEDRAAEPSSWDEAHQLLRPHAFDEEPVCGERARLPLEMQHVLDALGPTDDPEMLGRLGGYEVSGVVGYGAMGIVLKAFDKPLDRTVAIKVLAPHLASSGAARKRFAREAKAAAAVLHPNVMAIHGVSNDDTLPYLVMPYVRGSSLQKRLGEQGSLTTDEVLRIASQIAAGLAAAHAQGLVHRDIKPANIMLEDGVERVAITDFGLARAVDDATMTRTGVIAGTPEYMSPEQARGEFVDQRSDLFSLGTVIYTMCTGRAPFRAETSYGVLRRITDDEPRPICEINPNIPEWLCEIVAKLMSKQPDDRFESADEVAELLEGCLAHVQQPIAAPLPKSCLSLRKRRAKDKSPGTRPSFTRKPPVVRLMIGATFVFAMIFASILIVLESNKGTLTIECDADDVPVRIMRGDKLVEKLTVTRSGATVRIAAGEYVVEIDSKGDGIVVKDQTVELQRRGQRTVRIVQVKDSRELHVYCQLFDGTSVEGTFSNDDQMLQLQTNSGLVPIPLAKVERIEVGNDRETTSIVLVDGQHLAGFVESKVFHLNTGEKSVEVAYATLKKARMRRLWATPAKTPLKVAGAKASGVWRPYTIAGATDGDLDTSWNSGDYKGWIELDLGKMEKIVEVRTFLYMWPAGNATHLVYVSDKPIGQDRKEAKLIKTMSGTRRHGEVIFAECPPGTQGRYVQIHCPHSVSWFCLDEFQVFSER